MTIECCIRSHVNSIGSNDLFTTAEVLHCGPRPRVDQALYIMVRKRELVRWANGVFSKPSARPPSPTTVAKVKAMARGETLLECPVSTGATNGIHYIVFLTTGSDSSFKFGDIRIQFKHACRRKLKCTLSNDHVHH